MVKGCRTKCLQLSSPIVFPPILSAPADQRPEQTSTPHSDKRCRSRPQYLWVVQSDVCQGQQVSSNRERSGRLWWRIRKLRKWPLMTEEGCVRTCVFFTHMLYVIALSDISFCSFELQASAIMQECKGHKEHKNQRDKGIRESEREMVWLRPHGVLNFDL